MRFVNWPGAALGAALASLLAASANTEPARMLRCSVKGGEAGEPVWIGVFGVEAAEGNWTRATGPRFEVALPVGERATLLVVSKNRVPEKLAVGGGSPALFVPIRDGRGPRGGGAGLGGGREWKWHGGARAA